MIAKIRWTIEFDYPIADGGDWESNQFYLEESHCQNNLIEHLREQSESGCLCYVGEVELLGLIDD